MKTLKCVAALMSIGLAGAAQATPVVKIDGSSTVYPITEAVAEEFQIAKKGAVNVTVGISGTGGGFKKFCRGEIDISDASRPIKDKERKACAEAGIEYIEVPVAFDALTVIINPKNSFAGKLTMAELKTMWAPEAQGKILTWKEVNPAFPAESLKLYGPGADSGTFDYFTEEVVGKSKSSRGDFTASEDDNVLVQGVARDKGGLGYFGFAYYAENMNKLKAVAVDKGQGPVLPSAESVENGTYPLARPIFIYVNKKSLDKPEVAEFVNFYFDKAPALVKEVKYVPLPKTVYDLARANVKSGKVGTVYFEKVHGVKLDALLKRPAKL